MFIIIIILFLLFLFLLFLLFLLLFLYFCYYYYISTLWCSVVPFLHWWFFLFSPSLMIYASKGYPHYSSRKSNTCSFIRRQQQNQVWSLSSRFENEAWCCVAVSPHVSRLSLLQCLPYSFLSKRAKFLQITSFFSSHLLFQCIITIGRMFYNIKLQEDEFEDTDIPTTTIRSKADLMETVVCILVHGQLLSSLNALYSTVIHIIFMHSFLTRISHFKLPIYWTGWQRSTQVSTSDLVMNKLTEILSSLRQGSRQRRRRKEKEGEGTAGTPAPDKKGAAPIIPGPPMQAPLDDIE